jgi:hypothetical protein
MIEETLKAFMKSQPNPQSEDKLVVLKLTRYKDNKPKNLDEQNDLDEAMKYALDNISRDFVCNEIISMSNNVTMRWLNQFQTKDLFEMMYKMKKKLLS